MGGFNNTIKVDPSDKEVFEALDTDSTNHRHKPLMVESFAADTDYGQRIPDFATEWPVSISKDPPTLPPQLGTFNLPITYSALNLVSPFLSQNFKFLSTSTFSLVLIHLCQFVVVVGDFSELV